MAFEYRYSLNGGDPKPFEYIITNSETVRVGDSIKLATGFALRSGSAADVDGICVGIVDSNGRSLDRQNANYDGTWTESTQTYAAAADNETDKQVKVMVLVAKDAVYSVGADADLGTTTGSNLPGYAMDVVADSDELDESTAHATDNQFYSLGLDPQNSERVLVTIKEHRAD